MNYLNFVDGVTSRPSKHYPYFWEAVDTLEGSVNAPRLLTSAIGASAEASEYLEIADGSDGRHKLIELGDVLWYVAQGAMALKMETLPLAGEVVDPLVLGGKSLVVFTGKFLELVKKLIFQGKTWTPELEEEIVKLLGQITALIRLEALSLGTTLENIIFLNVTKLRNRYPDGFDAFMSENRQEGDL